MSSLRVGGLALVIGLVELQEDNGKCVTLLERLDYGGPEGLGWRASGDVWSHVDGKHGEACYQDRNLMPIDGEDFSHEDEHQKELTHG